jgi:hypothetical protein
LLTGVSNREAAEFALQHMQEVHQSAVSQGDAERGWTMLDRIGRSLDRGHAQLQPSDLFVILDEARCRGVDLKLHPDALGLLTLGPHMTKDKLMQAAGRLRGLDRGQRLVLTAAPDVTAELHALASQPDQTEQPITTQHCLQWVLHNTQAAQAAGLVEYGMQGVHFARTHKTPDRALQDEHTDLHELYSSARAELSAHLVVTTQADSCERECGAVGLSEHGERVLTGIREHAKTYGRDVLVTAGTLDEEIEQEVELEQETEEEREVEVERACPAEEMDWDYNGVLADYNGVLTDSVHDLPIKVLTTPACCH